VSATKISKGWQLSVKWSGYPDPTPEPLWKILKQTSNPTILQEIEKCKADYLAQHPRTITEESDEPTPSRSQPERSRGQPERFTFAVFGVSEPIRLLTNVGLSFRQLRDSVRFRLSALKLFLSDNW
jgi:hypothetical protein